MKNRSSMLLVVLMFILALGAGAVAGKLSNRLPGSQQPLAERGTLADVLQLTSDQQAKMRTIWEKTRDISRSCMDRADALQKAQDKTLMNLLTDEQREKYKELTQKTSGEIEVINQERIAAFSNAVDETDPILTESQRAIYHQIIKDRLGRLPKDEWIRP